MQILLTLTAQSKFFGNENKASDHTHLFIYKDEKKFSQPANKEIIT